MLENNSWSMLTKMQRKLLKIGQIDETRWLIVDRKGKGDINYENL